MNLKETYNLKKYHYGKIRKKRGKTPQEKGTAENAAPTIPNKSL